MSTGTINLTIIEAEEGISVTITENDPFLINFYEVALPDSRTVQAAQDAQEAESEAQDAQESAQAAQAAAEAAQDAAEAAVEEANQDSIINALIFG